MLDKTLQARNEKPTQNLQKQLKHTSKHFQVHHDILLSMLVQMIVLLVTTDTAQWSLSRPLLSLMMLLPEDYGMVVKNIVHCQKGMKRQRMAEIFTEFTEGIQMTLTTENHECFLSNVLNLQKEIKKFVDLNAFYAANISFSSLD
eukprot:TRINITY_DN16838_c0_g2_i1.p1 TRINITY_DN16838_c0_g2~~TRINITY_DN16838_c0_g2_i1.p1  ORF type:complete len:145 (-),score=37.10 TRINITY_DN16838_c0_g2_i1:154-588(-)